MEEQLDKKISLSGSSGTEDVRVEKRRLDITPSHLVVAFMAAVAVGNALSLRRRLLQIERIHNAAHEAGKQRQRVRTAQEEYARTRARQMREEEAKANAEEEMRRQTRWQHMKMEEDKERDRYRRAFARWQRETQHHQHQEQQHHYWDGKSFGHGWSEESENQKKSQHQRSRVVGRMSTEFSQHWQLLGLDRNRPQPFSHAEIKAAFREKAMEYHPDRNPANPEEAAKKFRQILDAYHALTEQAA